MLLSYTIRRLQGIQLYKKWCQHHCCLHFFCHCTHLPGWLYCKHSTGSNGTCQATYSCPIPQAFRTSTNLFNAWLARNDSNSAMGGRNGPISEEDKDDCNIRLEIIGGEYLLVASRIIVDHDKTRRTCVGWNGQMWMLARNKCAVRISLGERRSLYSIKNISYYIIW